MSHAANIFRAGGFVAGLLVIYGLGIRLSHWLYAITPIPSCATAEGPPDCTGMTDDAGNERHPTDIFRNGCFACLTNDEEAADRSMDAVIR